MVAKVFPFDRIVEARDYRNRRKTPSLKAGECQVGNNQALGKVVVKI